MTKTIEARIDTGALQRVSRLFNATRGQILNEMFQNARRSGASRIRVDVTAEALIIEDDGRGIDDPATLLAFGVSQWDEQVRKGEDAAGMGCYSLARRRTRIGSRTETDGRGWEVELEPAHFRGAARAVVRPATGQAPPKHGTRIAIALEDNESLEGVAEDVRVAATFMPIPVEVNGEDAQRQDFLGRARRTFRWGGVRIGVFSPGTGSLHAINFHGTLVRCADLPIANALRDGWTAHVDVVAESGLELTLPARMSIVENGYAEELRRECLRCIYRTWQQEHPQPLVGHAERQRAARLGIELEAPPARLGAWEPDTADPVRRRPNMYGSVQKNVGPESLLVAATMNTAESVMFGHAASLGRASARLLTPKHEYEGYGWYDRLPRIRGMDTRIVLGNATRTLEDVRGDAAADWLRPDRIVMTATVRRADGAEETIELGSDVALISDSDEVSWAEDIEIAVTKTSATKSSEIVEMMIDAYFAPDDSSGDADSRDTLLGNWRREALKTVTTVVAGADAAHLEEVHNAVCDFITPLVPAEETARVTIVGGRKSETRVELHRGESTETARGGHQEVDPGEKLSERDWLEEQMQMLASAHLAVEIDARGAETATARRDCTKRLKRIDDRRSTVLMTLRNKTNAKYGGDAMWTGAMRTRAEHCACYAGVL